MFLNLTASISSAIARFPGPQRCFVRVDAAQ